MEHHRVSNALAGTNSARMMPSIVEAIVSSNKWLFLLWEICGFEEVMCEGERCLYGWSAIFLREGLMVTKLKVVNLLINLKSKKVGEDTNCSHFIIQFEFCRINRVVSILPLSGLFSCERDGGGFHYFSKLYGLFMAKAREILIALSLATKAGCYHDLLPDDFNARFLSC
ncbi:hypothetical protein Tco_0445804 [Tanacetum coccineum]